MGLRFHVWRRWGQRWVFLQLTAAGQVRAGRHHHQRGPLCE